MSTGGGQIAQRTARAYRAYKEPNHTADTVSCTDRNFTDVFDASRRQSTPGYSAFVTASPAKLEEALGRPITDQSAARLLGLSREQQRFVNDQRIREPLIRGHYDLWDEDVDPRQWHRQRREDEQLLGHRLAVDNAVAPSSPQQGKLVVDGQGWYTEANHSLRVARKAVPRSFGSPPLKSRDHGHDRLLVTGSPVDEGAEYEELPLSEVLDRAYGLSSRVHTLAKTSKGRAPSDADDGPFLYPMPARIDVPDISADLSARDKLLFARTVFDEEELLSQSDVQPPRFVALHLAGHSSLKIRWKHLNHWSDETSADLVEARPDFTKEYETSQNVIPVPTSPVLSAVASALSAATSSAATTRSSYASAISQPMEKVTSTDTSGTDESTSYAIDKQTYRQVPRNRDSTVETAIDVWSPEWCDPIEQALAVHQQQVPSPTETEGSPQDRADSAWDGQCEDIAYDGSQHTGGLAMIPRISQISSRLDTEDLPMQSAPSSERSSSMQRLTSARKQHDDLRQYAVHCVELARDPWLLADFPELGQNPFQKEIPGIDYHPDWQTQSSVAAAPAADCDTQVFEFSRHIRDPVNGRKDLMKTPHMTSGLSTRGSGDDAKDAALRQPPPLVRSAPEPLSGMTYCSKCRKHFARPAGLQRHLADSVFHPYYCKGCTRDWATFAELNAHYMADENRYCRPPEMEYGPPGFLQILLDYQKTPPLSDTSARTNSQMDSLAQQISVNQSSAHSGRQEDGWIVQSLGSPLAPRMQSSRRETQAQGIRSDAGPLPVNNIVDAEPPTCPICIQPLLRLKEVLATACGHVYCAKCLLHYFSTVQNACPKCRTALPITLLVPLHLN